MNSEEYLMLREEIIQLGNLENNTINFFYVFVSAILAFGLGKNDSAYILLAYIIIIPAYMMVTQERNCRLDDRLQRAIGRALEERPDIKKSELQKINKIYIIANDKDLRPAYKLVLKEMMIYYCVS